MTDISTSASVFVPRPREEVFAVATDSTNAPRTLRPRGPFAGIREIEMTGVSIEGRLVGFGIPKVPGDPAFRGELPDVDHLVRVEDVVADAGVQASARRGRGPPWHLRRPTLPPGRRLRWR